MPPKLKDVDLSARFNEKHVYEHRLLAAQLKLLLLQRHVHQHRLSAILLFEGWDAAGKGGAIKRLTEKLDPRGLTVHLIGAPTAEEKQQNYLQRFWARMPRPGTFDIFDRSWYGRVLVERVEDFCGKDDWKRAYNEINAFERILVDGGTPVLKFFLHLSKDEQLRRFEERERDPFKNWKITDEDWRNRKKWPEYAKATDDMFAHTSTAHAPWHAIAAEHKWFARVQVVETTVARLSKAFDFKPELPKDWDKH